MCIFSLIKNSLVSKCPLFHLLGEQVSWWATVRWATVRLSNYPGVLLYTGSHKYPVWRPIGSHPYSSSTVQPWPDIRTVSSCYLSSWAYVVRHCPCSTATGRLAVDKRVISDPELDEVVSLNNPEQRRAAISVGCHNHDIIISVQQFHKTRVVRYRKTNRQWKQMSIDGISLIISSE